MTSKLQSKHILIIEACERDKDDEFKYALMTAMRGLSVIASGMPYRSFAHKVLESLITTFPEDAL